jgi:F-type H+-transporting ATPase subunit b
MNGHLFFAAGDLMDLAKSTGEQFGFNKQLFISQVISFCIVAFLLHRFAYKPILKVLEERRQKIAESLANAEKIKEELAKAQASAQEILKSANAQGNKLIEEARQTAAKVLRWRAKGHCHGQ